MLRYVQLCWVWVFDVFLQGLLQKVARASRSAAKVTAFSPRTIIVSTLKRPKGHKGEVRREPR